MSKELTLKQARWVEFYLGEAAGNATEAARLAGYGANEDTLRVIGCQNLTKYNIQQRIAERLAEQKVTPEEVRATLANHMRSDVTELFDETGVLDLQTIKEKRLGHLIKKIKRESRWEGRGEEKERVDTIELELHSSQSAATQLSKILGMEKAPAPNDVDEKRELARAMLEKLLLKGISETEAIDTLVAMGVEREDLEQVSA